MKTEERRIIIYIGCVDLAEPARAVANQTILEREHLAVG